MAQTFPRFYPPCEVTMLLGRFFDVESHHRKINRCNVNLTTSIKRLQAKTLCYSYSRACYKVKGASL